MVCVMHTAGWLCPQDTSFTENSGPDMVVELGGQQPMLKKSCAIISHFYVHMDFRIKFQNFH